MKPLKPRDKVTQRMTRAGLTLDNQTTGESMNISSREAEPEYTAKPDVTAEKALERAVDIRDRHKAKQAARHGERMAKEASGPASRLQFTAEERASPELAPYIKQAEKRADRLDAAKSALPKKRVIAKATVYDEAKGKARSKLHFEKVEKHPPKLKPNPASRPVREAGLYLHGKIHEVEQENVGVESGHKAEELAERQAGKALRNARRRHKLKPYRAAAKAERKSMAANAEFVYQKSLRDNPELAQAVSNPISRLWQKQHIKRDTPRPHGRRAGARQVVQRPPHQPPGKPQRKETGRVPCGPSLERGAADRRRGPASHADYGRPAILHRHVRQCRDGACGHLLSVRGQRYAGGRGCLRRDGS